VRRKGLDDGTSDPENAVPEHLKDSNARNVNNSMATTIFKVINTRHKY
jgi:hypothetical protein